MKLGTCVFLGATGLTSLGFATVLGMPGCSSSTATSTDGGTTPTTDSSSPTPGSDGGGGSDGGSQSTTTTQPPALPSGSAATASTTAQNFALHHIHLGDETDPVYGTAGWKAYGYDIDGLITTQQSTDVCTPNPTATDTKDQVDGPGGIDNSFGENIVGPLLSLLVTNPSQTISNSLLSGKFTFLMDVTGLSGTAGQTASGLSGSLFGGLAFSGDGGVPTFTTADNWPINSTYITSAIGDGGVLAQPIVPVVSLVSAYVVNGTFVSGTPQAVNLALTIGGYQVTIPIKHAQLTFNNPGDAGASQAVGGIISGVIKTTELISALGPIAASNNVCSELPALIPAIQQASDILDDGTNMAGTPCNAISIGIGFDADEIAQPTLGETPPTGAANCGDAG